MKALPKYLQERQSALTQLQNKVSALNDLSASVRRFLPEHLAPLCQVVRHDLEVLVVSVTEQVFLTQLRFLKVNLLAQLVKQNSFKTLKTIEIIFTPKAPGPNQPTNPSVQLSFEARNACLNAAELCHHPALQQALQRLAATDLNDAD